MRSKIGVASIAILLIFSLISVGGCVPAAPGELEPPEVKVAGVYPLELGAGSAAFEVVFSVYNPNSEMVVLDTLEWNLSTQYTTILDEVKTATLARRQLLDDVYIPANTEVRVTSAFSTGLAAIIGEVFMELGAEGLKYLPESMQNIIASGEMDPASAAGMVQVGAIAAMFPLWKLIGASRPPIDPNLDTFLELSVWDVSAEGPPLWTAEGTASFLSSAGPIEVGFQDQWKAE